jgi:ATP-dependent DNA helicase RecG
MLSPIEKLQRFIQLEINRGYDNRAVVGGLDKFQSIWQKEASGASIPKNVIETVSVFLCSYGSLDINQREQSIQDMISSIGRMPESLIKKSDLNTKHNKTIRTNYASLEQPENPMIQNSGSLQKAERKTANERSVVIENDENLADMQSASEKPAGDLASRERKMYRKRERSSSDPSLDSSVINIPGIGVQNAKALAKQNVYSVRDFLYYFPRRYDDYSQFKTINKLIPDESVTVIGIVYSVENQTRGKYQITEAVVGDGTGYIRVSWFNQPWLVHQIRVSQPIVLSGKIDIYLGRPVMNNPDWEPSEQENLNTSRIVPIYSVNSNLKQNFLRRMAFNTVRHWSGYLQEFLPDSVLDSANLLPLTKAIEQIHFPSNQDMLQEARKRLAFDEIFILQLCVLLQKRQWISNTADRFEISDDMLNRWKECLPYQLTNAQVNAIADIRKDLNSGSPMNRLIQGDVGSGKTIIACIAAAIVSNSDGQSVLMAPTSILAEQHYRNFLLFLEQIRNDGANIQIQPEQIALLIGSTPENQKREIKEKLSSGEILVVIGTHAIIEDPVKFKNLQLAIIDEQHRFGVEQRAALRSKGTNPHLLVMTATPIPRSLALTIYGDLDLTLIDEMPAGRKPVETFVMQAISRERIYQLIEREIKSGHQAFIIYPLVEQGDDEEREGKAAVEAQSRLQQEIFPDLRISLLHGRMKGDEKDAVLQAFKNREADILVSTSVIEVGVDVPNATVMLIEGADHFGLAQLHQFRGRVGRGADRSYCILIPENDSAAENERLKAMTETNDGFKLAEYDLNMRGPGDFIGNRQSGFMDLRLASLTDIRLIEKARAEAEKLFEQDPDLSSEANQFLKDEVDKALQSRSGEIS